MLSIDLFRRTAGAMVLHITYGYKIQEEGVDPLVGLADKVCTCISCALSPVLTAANNQALAEFSAITTPGAFLVDMLPALKYVPDWFPGYVFSLILSMLR